MSSSKVEPWWMGLLLEQHKKKFSDFAGAGGSVIIPISDRLITDVLRSRLVESIRDLDVRARTGNLVDVSVRLKSPAWLPRISAKVHVERQPQLPDSPVLILKLVSQGPFAALAGSAARFFDALPPWVRMEGDLIFLDLAQLLRRYAAFEVLSYLTRLEVTTRDGSCVVAIDGLVP